MYAYIFSRFAFFCKIFSLSYNFNSHKSCGCIKLNIYTFKSKHNCVNILELSIIVMQL